MELAVGVPNHCEFPPFRLFPLIPHTSASRSTELEQYVLRNSHPLQRHMACGRVRLPTHRRSFPRQLRSSSHRHIHHSNPKNQIQTRRPLIRRPRPFCRATFRRIGVLRTPISGRPATSFLAKPVGGYRYGSNPDVRYHDRRTCCVLCHPAALRIVGTREAGCHQCPVGRLGSLHLHMGEERTYPTYF